MTEQPHGVLRYRDPATDQFVPLAFPPHSHPDSGRLVGEIVAFAGANAPAGWLVCDGATIDQGTYPALFAVLGSQYGAPGRLPNLRGRSILGAGGSVYPTQGQTGGAATHGHTANPLPTHSHWVPTHSTNEQSHSHTTNPGAFTSGSGGSHSHTAGTNNNGFVSINPGGSDDVARTGHTHSIGSGGSHTHSIDVPSTTSSTHSHSHGVAGQASDAGGGVTPTIQSGDSYHPVLSLTYLIYAGN